MLPVPALQNLPVQEQEFSEDPPAPVLRYRAVPALEMVQRIPEQGFHPKQRLLLSVPSARQFVFAVYQPFGGQAVQPFVWAGDYAVRQAVWYCAAKLMTAFAVAVLPAVLMKLTLSLWVYC